MNVSAVEMEDEKHALITKQFENGRGLYRVELPCVIAVNQRINKVRYVNAMAALKAKKKPLEIWSAQELELDEALIGLDGSPSKNGELETVTNSKNCVMLEGSEDEIAAAIIEKLQPVLRI